MAQSLNDIVCIINTAFEGVFNGCKIYGVSILLYKDGKSQPIVNEMPVSIDDSYPMQIYHRTNSITIVNKDGFGDKLNTINTFVMSLYCFNNQRLTKLRADEIVMILQSVLSNININSVRILPISANLTSQVIYASEYRGNNNRLSEYYNLFQLNYNIEITFKSGCFDLCPEDYSQYKIN